MLLICCLKAYFAKLFGEGSCISLSSTWNGEDRSTGATTASGREEGSRKRTRKGGVKKKTETVRLYSQLSEINLRYFTAEKNASTSVSDNLDQGLSEWKSGGQLI